METPLSGYQHGFFHEMDYSIKIQKGKEEENVILEKSTENMEKIR